MGKSSFAALAALAEGAASRAADDDAVALAGEASDRVASDGVREHAAAATQAMPPTRMAMGLEEEGIGSRPSKERTYHCGARRCKPTDGSTARHPLKSRESR
jgi:hypothetical protein